MATHINKFDQLTSMSDADKRTALAILAKLPADLVKSWEAQLTVKEGHLCGTYYADVAASLSYPDFVTLYTALGYAFPKVPWYDMKCVYNPNTHVSGCGYATGYTCDLEYCL